MSTLSPAGLDPTAGAADAVDGPSLRLRDMVAVGSIRNQDRVIRPAYTRRGYEEQVKPRLRQEMHCRHEPLLRRAIAWLLALTVLFIFYASFYPFEFELSWARI